MRKSPLILILEKSDLPAEIIEGSISKWMESRVEEDIVRAKISYETDNERVTDRDLAIKINATDATTRVYQKQKSSIFAESTPIGLAKKLYDAVDVLHYDGEIVFENEESVGELYVGSVLNVKSANPLWASMNALVQCILEDADKGRTIIQFGPPKHLGVDDMVELLRTNRKRRATRSAARRISGKSATSLILEQPTHGRLENSTSGAGQYGRMVFSNPKKPECKIVLDAEAIKEPVKVELCEEFVCENGILKKRQVLASVPYNFKEE